MERRIEVDLPCPSCKKPQHLLLNTKVDLGKEPGAQYGILTDSLFTHACSNCGAHFQVSHELLVIHEDAGYAIFLVPGTKESEVAAPVELAGLKLRLVDSVHGLKEKILAFEGLLDDRTLELCKLYLGLRQNPDEDPYTLLFTEHRDGKLAFSKIDENMKTTEMLQIPDSLYLELDAKGKSLPTKEETFQRVDMAWAFERIASA